MDILLIILILIGHWASDYIFQTKKNIVSKGTDIISVLSHSAEYTTSMSGIVLLALLFGLLNQALWPFLISFWVITFTNHFIIDFVTSKLRLKKWGVNSKFEYHSILITDQILHIIILFLTISYLFY